MNLKVLIAAGGTGGHLFPAQQLSEWLLKEGDVELFFAGYKLQNSPFFAKEKIPFQEIASAPLKKILPFLKAAWRGFWQSIQLIRRYKPDVVVGFGSYHSFPVLLAAAVLRKKIVLFEANCILGKVNRLFLPVAEKIGIQFPLPKRNEKQVAVPYLPWISKKAKAVSREEARKAYRLDENLLTILVFGGSQGAVFLNQEFPLAAKILKKKGILFQVIHLTGKEGTANYDQIPAVVKTFEEDMPLAYAASDLVVCRSGAGTIAELIRFQKPALLIPYPFAADDHQQINGRFIMNFVQGARMVVQSEAAPERMVEEIEKLIQGHDKYRTALQNASLQTQIKTDFGTVVREVGKKR